VILRVWRTRIDEARSREYRVFAQERSLPMFRQQAGFVGVLFAQHGAERAVISLWRDFESVEALASSESYQATVGEIVGTGFLQGESSVEVFELEGAFLGGALFEDRADGTSSFSLYWPETD
jgi:heme-degrading monooxygenase HmoA